MTALYKQLVKFGITGVINTVIDFGLFNLLIIISGIHSGWGLGLINALTVSLAATNSYIMNRNWTFQANNNEQPVVKFMAATGIGILINSLVVTGVSSIADLLPAISLFLILNAGKILGSLFSITWNFISYRNWVFKTSNLSASEPKPDAIPDMLSIIIPAYNEAKRLPSRLRQLSESASQLSSLEIIVVNDGSSDDTAALALALAEEYSFIHCISHPTNLGKGAAVRTGMLASRGEFKVFVDADETFSMEHIQLVTEQLRNGHQVVVGSRQASAGERVEGESSIRRFMGKAFNFFVQALLLPGIFDTQCGLKGFQADVAWEIFSRQKLNGFAFDVEVLALTRALQYEVQSVSVQAKDCEGSSVNRFLSPLQMGWDVLRIKTGMILDLYHLPPTVNVWPEIGIGLSLFLIALAVRIPWLWHVPRYIDELKEVNLSYSIYLGKVLPLTNMAHDIGSMHNFILAFIFKLFGPSIFWPRLYVAITAALTVVLLYRLGLKMFDRWTGLLAAGLLLTNGMHIMVSHMAWANSTTSFFFMLAMLATLNAEEKKSGRWLLAAALFWAATLQTHSSVIIYVLAALIYVFSPHFRCKSEIKAGWYIGGALVFLSAYANMIYYNIITRGGSFTWLRHKSYALESQPGLASYANNFVQMFVELIRSVSSTFTETTFIHYWLNPAFVLAFILLIGGAYGAYKKGRTLPLWMILGGFLVIPWINGRYTFLLATRYIMPIIICSLLFIAYGIVTFSKLCYSRVKNPRTVLVPVSASMVILVIVQLLPIYQYCGRADSTNLSNKVALNTIAIVNKAALGDASLVLVEEDLNLENQPIPYLLTMINQKYILVPSKPNPNQNNDPWMDAMDKYRNQKLVAIMNKTTYLRIKDNLPYAKAHSLSADIAFPQPLTIPRTIYVMEINSMNEQHSSRQASSTAYYDRN